MIFSDSPSKLLSSQQIGDHVYLLESREFGPVVIWQTNELSRTKIDYVIHLGSYDIAKIKDASCRGCFDDALSSFTNQQLKFFSDNLMNQKNLAAQTLAFIRDRYLQAMGAKNTAKESEASGQKSQAQTMLRDSLHTLEVITEKEKLPLSIKPENTILFGRGIYIHHTLMYGRLFYIDRGPDLPPRCGLISLLEEEEVYAMGLIPATSTTWMFHRDNYARDKEIVDDFFKEFRNYVEIKILVKDEVKRMPVDKKEAEPVESPEVIWQSAVAATADPARLTTLGGGLFAYKCLDGDYVFYSSTTSRIDVLSNCSSQSISDLLTRLPVTSGNVVVRRDILREQMKRIDNEISNAYKIEEFEEARRKKITLDAKGQEESK